jgi:ABC-type multidrug transport system fused ATPase/permease subunit
VYFLYLRAAGAWLFLYLLCMVIASGCYLGGTIWVQIWSDSNAAVMRNASNHSIPTGPGLIIYGAAGLGRVVFIVLGAYLFTFGKLKACKKIHSRLLKSILRAPMTFFDTTPTGRILNRFSKDIDTVDQRVPGSVDSGIQAFSFVILSIVAILYATPLFGVTLIPLGALYYFIQVSYLGCVLAILLHCKKFSISSLLAEILRDDRQTGPKNRLGTSIAHPLLLPRVPPGGHQY